MTRAEKKKRKKRNAYMRDYMADRRWKAREAREAAQAACREALPLDAVPPFLDGIEEISVNGKVMRLDVQEPRVCKLCGRALP